MLEGGVERPDILPFSVYYTKPFHFLVYCG